MIDPIRQILAAFERKESVVVATVVGPFDLGSGLIGRRLILRADGTVIGSLGLPSLDERVVACCHDAMEVPSYARVQSYELTSTEGRLLAKIPGSEIEVFVETVQSTESLLVVGAGHIAQPLSAMAKMLGFEVTVIDDRPSFANRDRFPEADRIITGYFSDELGRFAITPSTYVILVTRGHVHDEMALRKVIGSDAAYIGMIGSRRRVGAVLRHMVEEGIPKELVERVYTPIGLDIGAQTPEEIAISIMAEVVFVRRRGFDIHHPCPMNDPRQPNHS